MKKKDIGLTYSEKMKMLIFGIFIILVTGTRIFYHLHGSDKQKRQTLTYYFMSLFLWISLIIIALIIAKKYEL